mmetsp:Transcript_603/g.1877  ORF Transcript_603/g.1877 Transcript_603/m.1877 type:complete len:245 (+) Transcript_603:341-1075(+)
MGSRFSAGSAWCRLKSSGRKFLAYLPTASSAAAAAAVGRTLTPPPPPAGTTSRSDRWCCTIAESPWRTGGRSSGRSLSTVPSVLASAGKEDATSSALAQKPGSSAQTCSCRLCRFFCSTVRPSAPSAAARSSSHAWSGTKYAAKKSSVARATWPRSTESSHEESSPPSLVDTLIGSRSTKARGPTARAASPSEAISEPRASPSRWSSYRSRMPVSSDSQPGSDVGPAAANSSPQASSTVRQRGK